MCHNSNSNSNNNNDDDDNNKAAFLLSFLDKISRKVAKFSHTLDTCARIEISQEASKTFAPPMDGLSEEEDGGGNFFCTSECP